MILKEIDIPEFTLGDLNRALTELYYAGHQVTALRMRSDAILRLADFAEEAGEIRRQPLAGEPAAVTGTTVTGYVHPVTRRVVEIVADRAAPGGRVQIEGKEKGHAEEG